MNTMLCSVSGMGNKEAKTQIKNALGKLDGVGEVGGNLLTGTVRIDYNDPVTRTQLKECIEKTGFKIIYE